MDPATVTTELPLKTPQCTQSKSNMMTVNGGELECLLHNVRSQKMAEFLNFFALVMVKIKLATTGRKQIQQLLWHVLTKLDRQLMAWHAYCSAFGCSCKGRFFLLFYFLCKRKTFPFLVELLSSNLAKSSSLLSD